MQLFNDFIWTPVIIFVMAYLLVRFTGKKSVAQMNSFDLIVILILGTSITEPIVSKNNWMAVWFSLVIVLCYLALSRLVLVNKFKSLLTNSPTVLIRNGDIDKQGLKKIRMHTEDLLATLRLKGYTSVKDIAIAVMEESGRVSVIPESDKRPLQPNDIQLTPSPTFLSIPLIIDGEVINHNLKYLDKDMDWLLQQMQTHNLEKEDIRKINLAAYNQLGIVEFNIHKDDADKETGPYSYKPGNEN